MYILEISTPDGTVIEPVELTYYDEAKQVMRVIEDISDYYVHMFEFCGESQKTITENKDETNTDI